MFSKKVKCIRLLNGQVLMGFVTNAWRKLSYTIEDCNILVYNNLLSLHDISDGGLLITLLEMSIVGNIGIDINIVSCNLNKNNALYVLLSRCLPMTCGLTFGHLLLILYIEIGSKNTFIFIGERSE